MTWPTKESKAMALHFPNASRAYIPVKKCIRFWGHDSTSEITFEVTHEALCGFSAKADDTETALLGLFDDYRQRIEVVATRIFGREKQSYIHLSSENF